MMGCRAGGSLLEGARPWPRALHPSVNPIPDGLLPPLFLPETWRVGRGRLVPLLLCSVRVGGPGRGNPCWEFAADAVGSQLVPFGNTACAKLGLCGGCGCYTSLRAHPMGKTNWFWPCLVSHWMPLGHFSAPWCPAGGRSWRAHRAPRAQLHHQHGAGLGKRAPLVCEGEGRPPSLC